MEPGRYECHGEDLQLNNRIMEWLNNLKIDYELKPGRYECRGEGLLPGVGGTLGKQLSILRCLNRYFSQNKTPGNFRKVFSAAFSLFSEYTLCPTKPAWKYEIQEAFCGSLLNSSEDILRYITIYK